MIERPLIFSGVIMCNGSHRDNVHCLTRGLHGVVTHSGAGTCTAVCAGHPMWRGKHSAEFRIACPASSYENEASSRERFLGIGVVLVGKNHGCARQRPEKVLGLMGEADRKSWLSRTQDTLDNITTGSANVKPRQVGNEFKELQTGLVSNTEEGVCWVSNGELATDERRIAADWLQPFGDGDVLRLDLKVSKASASSGSSRYALKVEFIAYKNGELLGSTRRKVSNVKNRRDTCLCWVAEMSGLPCEIEIARFEEGSEYV